MENEGGKIGELRASINPLISSFFGASEVFIGFPPKSFGVKAAMGKLLARLQFPIANEREIRT